MSEVILNNNVNATDLLNVPQGRTKRRNTNTGNNQQQLLASVKPEDDNELKTANTPNWDGTDMKQMLQQYNGNLGDTPKGQKHSEFSFAGNPNDGEPTDRSKKRPDQDQDFTTLQQCSESLASGAGGSAKGQPVTAAQITFIPGGKTEDENQPQNQNE